MSKARMQECYEVLIFLGFTLARCNNGKAWEAPFKKVGENPFSFNMHGVLFGESAVGTYRQLRNKWSNLISIGQWIVLNHPELGFIINKSIQLSDVWNDIVLCARAQYVGEERGCHENIS
ncbi:MAG: hypothetical protein QM504_10195 [Pseudomonadota bacterium]